MPDPLDRAARALLASQGYRETENEMDRAREEAQAVLDAVPVLDPARALLAALDQAWPEIVAAQQFAAMHGQEYTGPSLREPIEALRKAVEG